MSKRWLVPAIAIFMITGCTGGSVGTGSEVLPDGSIDDTKADNLNPTQPVNTDMPTDSCTNLGDEEDCYSGPAETNGVGLCAAGIRTCGGSLEFPAWGLCVGEVLPFTTPSEVTCNDGLDNNCDGVEDDEGECPGGNDGDDCGDGECTGDETYSSCAEDCPSDGTESECGDGECTHWETIEDCEQDCADDDDDDDDVDDESECGDQECTGDETFASCAMDCPDDGTEGECGDTICTHTETNSRCPEDCPEDGTRCGDGTCSGAETFGMCPIDCPDDGTEGECGDDLCSHDETLESCPEDCGEGSNLPEQYEVWLMSADIDMSDFECEGVWGWLGNECDFEADVYLGDDFHGATGDDDDADWNENLFTAPTSLLLSEAMELQIEDDDTFLTLGDDGAGSCMIQVTEEDLIAGELIVTDCGGDIDEVIFEFVAIE